MSGGHSHTESEHGPENWQKAAANIVAGLIIGIAQVFTAIFKSIFRFLQAAV